MRQNDTNLTQRIRQSHVNLGPCIFLLLEIDERFFDCVQLTFGIGKKASLPDFDQVSNVIFELFLSTYPVFALGVRFENEFRHNSL
jgi:hypothetical protein